MRRFLPCLALLLCACGQAAPAEDFAQAGEACGGMEKISCQPGLICAMEMESSEGTCVRGSAPDRTAAWFAQRIDERMTEADVIEAFGQPDRDIGSGIHIYVYTLEDDSEVWIGLADRVLYARNVDADGNLIEVLTDGAALESMDGEPVAFDPGSGMQLRKRTREAATELAFVAATCGGDADAALREAYEDVEHALYVVTDRDGAAAFTVSVLPNMPGFADQDDAAAAFGCTELPLIAINERWLVFGLRSGPGADALAAEQSVLSTITPR